MNSTRLGLPRPESIFSIFMGLAALLGIWDPRLEYPAVLWAFAAFLAFNFAGHWASRRWSGAWAARLTIAGNAALVTWIVHVSGRADSYFWPMYLLPLFSASVQLKPRELRLWVLVAAAPLAWSYRLPIKTGHWERAVEWSVKAAGLALAAAVAGRISSRDKVHSLRLEHSRRKLSRLALEAGAVGAGEVRPSETLDGFLKDLGNAMTIVMGSADLLLLEVPETSPHREDATRIHDAALRCRDLQGRMRVWSSLSARTAPRMGAQSSIDEILGLFEQQVRSRSVRVSRNLPESLPPLGAGSLPVQQAVISLMHQIVERTADGARLDVTAEALQGGIALRLVSERLRPSAGTGVLQHCADLLRRHGGSVATRAVFEGLECDIYVPGGES